VILFSHAGKISREKNTPDKSSIGKVITCASGAT